MKILIISLPRTGSTNLMRDLSRKHKIKSVFEPFDGSDRESYNMNMKNIVLKTIVEQQPNKDLPYLDFIKDLISQFDQTILLSRRNLNECAQSHAYFVYNRGNGFTSNSEYFWEPTPIDDLCFRNITKWNGILEKLSNDLEIPITYYEDIYDTKAPNRLRKGNKEEIKKALI